MSPTEPFHRLPAPRPVRKSSITSSIRETVSSWHARTLRVQATGDLLRAYNVLKPHEKTLAEHTPHAPRLLANLTQELTKRGALPC